MLNLVVDSHDTTVDSQGISNLVKHVAGQACNIWQLNGRPRGRCNRRKVAFLTHVTVPVVRYRFSVWYCLSKMRKMVPPVRLELTTPALRMPCSTN